MKNQEMGVSVCCLVYNHEKYLRKCFDAFVNQKTNFKYEILIHDDASTDNSKEIIKEYVEKYPTLFKPLYQQENQTSKGKKVSFEFQYPRVTGKYIAWCEGDDYWTDDFKLQKQYDMLEQFPDKVFCTHIVRSVTESGDLLESTHPKTVDLPMHLESDEWIRMLLGDLRYPFQTSSYFGRADVLTKYINQYPDFIKKAKVGDTPLMLLYATHGGCIYLKEEMSCYRRQSSGSWSQRKSTNVDMWARTILARIEMYKEYDVFTGRKYTDLIMNICTEEEFKYLQVRNNYEEMMHRKYKVYFKKMPVKQRIYALISARIPFVMLLYVKFKRGRHYNE